MDPGERKHGKFFGTTFKKRGCTDAEISVPQSLDSFLFMEKTGHEKWCQFLAVVPVFAHRSIDFSLFTVKTRIGYPPFPPKVRPKKFGGYTIWTRNPCNSASFFCGMNWKKKGVHNSRGYPIRVFTVFFWKIPHPGTVNFENDPSLFSPQFFSAPSVYLLQFWKNVWCNNLF